MVRKQEMKENAFEILECGILHTAKSQVWNTPHIPRRLSKPAERSHCVSTFSVLEGNSLKNARVLYNIRNTEFRKEWMHDICAVSHRYVQYVNFSLRVAQRYILIIVIQGIF